MLIGSKGEAIASLPQPQRQEIRIQIIPTGNDDRIFQIVMLISFNIGILIQELSNE